ncbi:sensor histidine kinase [Plantactinospora endophytica]|uniref:Histidine kinase n=1 Tax=Plantactinospora endophytica TaxID=673535 RepID=A0ABQ4E8V0_9ACTN|nr:histidine kinase [Plantactinospora endophytica]GIG91155.1 histidine kinase [Plantactinospora endophytica]
MRDLIGWWARRGQPERFDLVTRATLYLVLATEPVALFNATAVGAPTAGRMVVLGLGVVHTVLCLLAVRAGVEHFLGRRDRPIRLVVGVGWLTLATVVAAQLADGLLPPEPDQGRWTLRVTVLVSCYFLGALCTMTTPRYASVGAVGLAGVVLAVGLLDGAPPGLLLQSLTALCFGFLVLLFTFRCSLWMLGVLWELERSRGNQVRLAVAEERLRFARDLHDVLGRNLSVVALKSELAAQLAKRDRPRAVEEMLEVRQIAQDSLAEVREVVRGYRAVDLDAELAGARAVLTSAGVRCRVLGEGHELSPQAQSALGWVVREGTTNVLRHSEALTCTVSLRHGRPTPGPDAAVEDADDPARYAAVPSEVTSVVTLVMENDGVRPGGPPVFGNGLLGLSERLAPLGGRVAATRPGRDRFRLTAQLPLAAQLPPAAGGPSDASSGPAGVPASDVTVDVSPGSDARRGHGGAVAGPGTAESVRAPGGEGAVAEDAGAGAAPAHRSRS